MVNCCILYCKSSSLKGDKFKCFPKNTTLKESWLKNINRVDWSPTSKSCVCQLHFASDMWKTENNKKMLKSDAVPTIFPNAPERKRYPGKIVISSRTKKMAEVTGNVDRKQTNIAGEFHFVNVELNIKTDNVCDVSNPIISNKSSSRSILKKPTNQTSGELKCEDENKQVQYENTSSTLLEKKNTPSKYNEDVEKLFCKQEKKIKNLQYRLQCVMKENRKLAAEKHRTFKGVLLKLFNEDQISNLVRRQSAGRNSVSTRWSNSTIKKALRLMHFCGKSGYEELLRQGLPLPSSRTLRRKIEHIDLQPEISEYLECKIGNSETHCDREYSIALEEGAKKCDPQIKEEIRDITLPPD